MAVYTPEENNQLLIFYMCVFCREQSRTECVLKCYPDIEAEKNTFIFIGHEPETLVHPLSLCNGGDIFGYVNGFAHIRPECEVHSFLCRTPLCLES